MPNHKKRLNLRVQPFLQPVKKPGGMVFLYNRGVRGRMNGKEMVVVTSYW